MAIQKIPRFSKAFLAFAWEITGYSQERGRHWDDNQ
jgi:hypothetical protein